MLAARNQGIIRIEKNVTLIAINRKITMTLMRLIVIKYFNRLTALICIYKCMYSYIYIDVESMEEINPNKL